MEKIVFLDNTFWKEDKEFIDLINTKILPRIEWAMDNEENYPSSYHLTKNTQFTIEDSKERCSNNTLDGFLKEYKNGPKGWTIDLDRKPYKQANYKGKADSISCFLANLSYKIERWLQS